MQCVIDEEIDLDKTILLFVRKWLKQNFDVKNSIICMVNEDYIDKVLLRLLFRKYFNLDKMTLLL